MADLNALLVVPEKHPFQMDSLPGPKGAYEMTQSDNGFFLRLDMPGVEQSGLKIYKRSERKVVTFNGVAPRKESFPFDESERVYAGVVQLDRDPNQIEVDVMVEDGSVILLFPDAEGALFFLPPPRSAPGQTSSGSGKPEQGEGSSGKSTDKSEVEGSGKSKQGEGSSSGKSVDEAAGSTKSQKNAASSSGKCIGEAEGTGIDQSNPDAMSLEGSGKSESANISFRESPKGLGKPEQGEDSSFGKSTDKAEGSTKSEEGEGSSGKCLNEAEGMDVDQSNLDAASLEGPGKSESPKISSHESPKGSADIEKGEHSSLGKSIDKDQDSSAAKPIDEAGGSKKSGSDKSSTEAAQESTKSKQVEGSSQKSIGEAEGSAKSGKSSHESAEGSAKSKQGEGSPQKSVHKAQGSGKPRSGKSSRKSAKGSAKSKQGQGSSSGKSVKKAEGSTKHDQVEGSSTGKSVNKGSGKSDSSKSSHNKNAEDWMIACIKKNVLQIDEPEPPKEESAPMQTSPSEQPSHEVPEIAIGSVEECTIHHPKCQCRHCDSNGICLRTWSTTEDNFGHINRLKIKGADGVCEKRVMQEDGWYSVYVRADLPGLEPHLCVITVRDHCILVFGKPQPRELYIQGARNYLFFVQLRCSCCRFDNIYQDYEHGVLRIFGKIVGLNPNPSAD